MQKPEKSKKIKKRDLKRIIESLETENLLLQWKLEDVQSMNDEILNEHTLYLAWLWLFDQRIRLNKGGLFADQIIQQGKAEIPRIIQEYIRCTDYMTIFTDRWII